MPRCAAVSLSDDTALTEAQAETWAARCEVKELQAALDAANAQIEQLKDELSSRPQTQPAGEQESDDGIKAVVAGPLFDAIDINHDNELTREEFIQGYALYLSETASKSFDAIDANGDGVLSREEFERGYNILTSDDARAAAEREKLERAVALERVRATKAAAVALAEAELMDRLNTPSASPSAGGRKGRSGRDVLGGPPPRKWSGEPYKVYGTLPAGFDKPAVEALVQERVEAKMCKDYAKADELQQKLLGYGVRLDDRWRTWSCGGNTPFSGGPRSGGTRSAQGAGGSASGRGKTGGSRGRAGKTKRLSPGELRWREGANPQRAARQREATQQQQQPAESPFFGHAAE